MKYVLKVLIGGLFLMSACVPLFAQTTERADLKVTIQLTNNTISVNATNIPATVTIENTSKETIKFYFAASALALGIGERIQFEVPSDGKVRIRDTGAFDLEYETVTLKPGGKFIDNFDLGNFLEFIEAGEYEIGFKGNLRVFRNDERYAGKKSGRVVSFHGVIKVTVQEKRP